MSGSNLTKFSLELMDTLKRTLQKEHNRTVSDADLHDQIESMSKVEVMDKYLESLEGKMNADEVCKVVKEVYKIDLDTKPVLPTENDLSAIHSSRRAIINSHLRDYGENVTAKESRMAINQIFGINLDGISALDKARISLYSKGQWLAQKENDLFAVYTGDGDIDAEVVPTKYFTEKTGLKTLPNELQYSLSEMGYYFDDKRGNYYYSNPTGQAVSNHFKTTTMGKIGEVIQKSFSHL